MKNRTALLKTHITDLYLKWYSGMGPSANGQMHDTKRLACLRELFSIKSWRKLKPRTNS